MRNLFLFIWKYNFFFLFILLETGCFLLIAQGRGYQSSTLLNSTNTVSATLYSALANTKEYLNLKEENDRLAKENALLYNQLKNAYELIPTHKTVIRDTLYRQKYIYIPAKVINNSINRRDNYLTLNIGSNQGVVKDMGIFNSEGIVGVVKDVSGNYSSCMSFLHKNVMVPVRLKDGNIGQLKWDGNDPRFAFMTDVQTHANITIGDTIITSSLSALFPEGIRAGIIENFERRAGDPYYTVKIKLITNFSKLNHVTVVTNLYKAEQDSLEFNSQREEKK
jgi:rod shape-determining protein MreC